MAAHGVDFRLAGLLKGRFNEPGKFGRMFPHLRSLKPAQLAVSPGQRCPGCWIDSCLLLNAHRRLRCHRHVL